MIQPAVLAQLCADIYDPATPGVREICGVTFSITRVGDVDVLCCRGSQTVQDWLRDFTANPIWHPQLGFCHAGFLFGMDAMFAAVRKAVGARVAITGHSLGGAEARLQAGLFACAGLPVEQLTVFGSPKPAFINLARILEKSSTVHTSFRNRNDPVPMVPFTLPPFADFVHTEPWIGLDEPAAPNDLDPLRDHHIARYVEGLGKMSAAPAPAVALAA